MIYVHVCVCFVCKCVRGVMYVCTVSSNVCLGESDNFLESDITLQDDNSRNSANSAAVSSRFLLPLRLPVVTKSLSM